MAAMRWVGFLDFRPAAVLAAVSGLGRRADLWIGLKSSSIAARSSSVTARARTAWYRAVPSPPQQSAIITSSSTAFFTDGQSWRTILSCTVCGLTPNFFAAFRTARLRITPIVGRRDNTSAKTSSVCSTRLLSTALLPVRPWMDAVGEGVKHLLESSRVIAFVARANRILKALAGSTIFPESQRTSTFRANDSSHRD